MHEADHVGKAARHLHHNRLALVEGWQAAGGKRANGQWHDHRSRRAVAAMQTESTASTTPIETD